MQLNLFEIPPTPKEIPKDKCKNCIHLYHHYYNKSMKYCSKQRSDKRTAYGNKKIKANDPACILFTKIEK